MEKEEFIENQKINFSNQMDPEMEGQMTERKTISQWCIKCNIRILGPEADKLYEDQDLYTISEFEIMVPRNLQVPLGNTETGLTNIASSFVPKDFAKKYKQMLKLQDELKKTEENFKSKLLEMFESIPDLENNSVIIDGLKFTYVNGSVRKTVDTKKLQEEMPEIYNKFLKESRVKSSIRTSVEF